MRKALLLLFVLGFYIDANAQQAKFFVKNTSLSKPDTPLLYIGISNRMKVYAPKMKAESINATSYKVTLVKDRVLKDTTWMVFNVMPGTNNNPAEVYFFNKTAGTFLREIKYHAVPLPKPTVRIGTIKDSVISKETFLQQNEISATIEKTLLAPKYAKIRLYNYTFSAILNGKPVEIKANGDRLSPVIKDIVKQLPPNTPVLFSNFGCDLAGIEHRILIQ